MDSAEILKLFENIPGSIVKTDEYLKNNTSFKVGGPADFFIVPDNKGSLIEIYRKCLEEKIQVFILGNGTNLIVRDKGIRGVVIKIAENLGRYSVDDLIIKAEAGIGLARLSKIALEHSLTGLEFAEGIPGTLGGAIVMNAGAYDGEMANVVVRTEYLDKKGNISLLAGDGHKFGKRSSYIQDYGGLVLGSELKLEKGNYMEIKEKMDKFNRLRREKQPLELPSAGSIFKRPEGYFAGKLIQDCGLGGFNIGGAEVSGRHCGFIVNRGGTTAKDIICLIDYIKKTVKDRFDVELQTEVKIVGEE